MTSHSGEKNKIKKGKFVGVYIAKPRHIDRI